MPKLKRLIIFIIGILVISAGVLFSFIRQQYVVPIIMYHSVYPGALPKNRLAVTDKTFQRQMQFLKKHNYHVLSLEELAILIKEKKKIPPHSLAITFDDGFKDNYTYAFPILKKYNLPATIFLIINEVGRKENDKLSWDEIKVMQDSGLITFGSHTLTHKYLEEFKGEEELKKEVFDSKRILEEKLGRPVNIFSYPTGRFTAAFRQMVINAGYKVAVTTSPGKKFANDDIFALKRLRISANCDNLFVFWVETSGYYTFLKERRDAD